MSSTQTTKSPPAKSAPGKIAPPVVRSEKAAPPAARTERASPPDAAMSDAEKRDVLIRIAAYSFYERRGCVGGHELEDWLQAEMEVDRQLAAAEPPKPAK